MIAKKYMPRINYIHMKDVRSNKLAIVKDSDMSFIEAVALGVFTVPGDGDIDFDAVIDQIKRDYIGSHILVEAEQDPRLAPPLDHAKKAYCFMKKHFVV